MKMVYTGGRNRGGANESETTSTWTLAGGASISCTRRARWRARSFMLQLMRRVRVSRCV